MYGTLISSVTVGAGGASSIDFTSIPGTYTDLVLVYSFRVTDGSSTGQFYLTLNSDTTESNYYRRTLIGTGASTLNYAGAQRAETSASGNTATSNTFSNGMIVIPNYAGSAAKSFSIDSVTENNSSSAWQTITAGKWSGTSAITAVGFRDGGTLMQYSTAYLYGLTKGSGGATVS